MPRKASTQPSLRTHGGTHGSDAGATGQHDTTEMVVMENVSAGRGRRVVERAYRARVLREPWEKPRFCHQKVIWSLKGYVQKDLTNARFRALAYLLIQIDLARKIDLARPGRAGPGQLAGPLLHLRVEKLLLAPGRWPVRCAYGGDAGQDARLWRMERPE